MRLPKGTRGLSDFAPEHLGHALWFAETATVGDLSHRQIRFDQQVDGELNKFFNLIIRPFPVVFLQVLNMVMIGFFYAILVMYGRSIWPAMLFHWTTNASVELALYKVANFEETIVIWIGYTLISIVPVLVSLWMFKSVQQNEPVFATGLSTSPPLTLS